MKITIINGSPRFKKSNSEILKNYLLNYIKENEINEYFSFSIKLDNDIKTYIYSSDVLIFIFPLYVDSIPANLLDLLVRFEDENTINPKTKIYCIVNNGFFEGIQNHLAISQIRCWSKKVCTMGTRNWSWWRRITFSLKESSIRTGTFKKFRNGIRKIF